MPKGKQLYQECRDLIDELDADNVPDEQANQAMKLAMYLAVDIADSLNKIAHKVG